MLFKNKNVSWLVGINILLFLFYACTHERSEISPCEGVNSSYAQSIAPIIQTRCALPGCHNGDSVSVGNFSNYDEIKIRVDNGQFKIKVFDTKSMPPASLPALPSGEYNKLKCWFDSGAPNN